MKYFSVHWRHDSPEDPVIIYAETDDDRWEHRKIEVFRDGRQGFADETAEQGGSMLGLEPWPELQRIGEEPEFEVAEITQEQFERLWSRRHLQLEL